MSAQYEKRSCYGISLVLTEKAEKSKAGCLGPWRWWGWGGKAARRAGGDPGDEHLQSCSHSVQGSGSDSPSIQTPEQGSCRIFVEACYCFARALCAGCLLLLARWRQEQVTGVTTPAQRGGGRGRWQRGRLGAPVSGSERSGPKWLGQGRCWHVTGWGCWRSWSLFFSLLLLFPLHFCLPTSPAPPHQPFVDTWSFTSSWHSQSLLRGL